MWENVARKDVEQLNRGSIGKQRDGWRSGSLTGKPLFEEENGKI